MSRENFELAKFSLDLEFTPACILGRMMSYTIGEISRETGLSIDTLRYYERIELLVDIGRNASGHRYYTADDLSWIGLLVCLRETDMPIADMLKFAKLIRSGVETIPERFELLKQHKENVLSKIAYMEKKLVGIENKIAHYSQEVNV